MSIGVLIGQSPRPIHYAVDDGLPANEVYDVYEDSLGYIWLATDHGVARFNGLEFKNFTTQDGLCDNTVFSVKPDHQQRIWVRGLNGCLSYLVGDHFAAFPFNDQLQAALGELFIEDFHWTREGDLYFRSSGGASELFVWEHRQRKVRRLPIPAGDNLALVYEDGRPVMGNYSKSPSPEAVATKMPAAVATFRVHLKVAAEAKGLIASNCLVQPLSGGSALVAIQDHVYQWQSDSTLGASVYVPRRAGIAVDRDGNVFVAGKGLWHWSPAGFRAVATGGDFESVTKSLQDRSGHLWAAGHQGLWFFPNRYAQNLGGNVVTSLPHAWRIHPVRGGVVVLTVMGSKVYFVPMDSSGIQAPGPELIGADFSYLHDFAVDASGTSLVSSGRPIRLLNQQTSPIRTSRGIIEAGGSIDMDRFGTSYYLANRESWVLVDSNFRIIFHGRAHGFRGWCTAIQRDSSGQVWVGTKKGLMVDNGRETSPFMPGNPLFRARVTSIEIGPHGILAVSTRGNGLILIRGKQYLQLDQRHGLPSNLCGNLAWGSHGLWVASHCGLSLVAWDQGRINVKVFTTQLGLSSLMVNDVVEINGLAIAATENGIDCIHPNAFDDIRLVHPTRITQVYVQGKPCGLKARLSKSDRQIQFDFEATRIVGARNMLYRYRLQGKDPGWRVTGDRSIGFFGLEPGNYTFEVTSQLPNGLWDERVARWAFHVPAYLHETWGFRFAIGVLLTLLIFVFFRWRYMVRRHHLAREIHLQKAEIKALRAQMKPHFMYNALNAIQNHILKGDTLRSAQFLSQFADLTRRILSQSDRSTISVADEIETLQLYIGLERLRFSDLFDCEVLLSDPGLQKEEIPPMLIQPFVENAILHGLLPMAPGEPRRLVIEVHALPNGHRWRIQDNGVGRKANAAFLSSKHHQSTALRNIQERIALMNALGNFLIKLDIQDLYDEKDRPQGTLVELTLLAKP